MGGKSELIGGACIHCQPASQQITQWPVSTLRRPVREGLFCESIKGMERASFSGGSGADCKMVP